MNQVLTQEMSESSGKIIASAIEKYSKQLFGFIRSKVKSTEDAEDVLQDVWYQFSDITNISEIQNTSAWLYSVARNKVIDLYRKKSTESLEDYTIESEDGEFNIKDILLIDDSASPDLALFKDAFWKEMLKALDELPENQKQVFILNELEDFTLKEIADKNGENIKTIISRKSYAVKHLRNRLKYLYQELYT